MKEIKIMNEIKTKKEIKIVPSNKEPIEDLLSVHQKNTWKRELKLSDIKEGVQIAEKLLDNVLFKKNRQNIKAKIRPLYYPFKPSYGRYPMQTVCHIRRGAKYWFITKIERVAAQRSGSTRLVIEPSSIVLKSEKVIEYLSKNLKGNEVLNYSLSQSSTE
jgi:hypothetical protein